MNLPFFSKKRNWNVPGFEEIPRKVYYEITQKKQILGKAESESAVIKKGKINKRRLFLDWKGRRFFVTHILKESDEEKTRYIVRWDVNYSEAMNADGKITFSPEIENLDMDDMVSQLKKAVSNVQGLNLDRNTITILLLALVFGIPIGLSLWPQIIPHPGTIVHWVPR